MYTKLDDEIKLFSAASATSATHKGSDFSSGVWAVLKFSLSKFAVQNAVHIALLIEIPMNAGGYI